MYDLSEDPGEQNDLSETDRAGEFQELVEKYGEWNVSVASRRPPSPEKPTEIDPRLLRQLKSMGYVR